jgi:hypothetical protein
VVSDSRINELCTQLSPHVEFLREHWKEFFDMVERFGEHWVKCAKDPKLQYSDDERAEDERRHQKARTASKVSLEYRSKYREAKKQQLHGFAERFARVAEKADVEAKEFYSKLPPPEKGWELYKWADKASYYDYINLPDDVDIVFRKFWITAHANPLPWFLEASPADLSDEEQLIYDCAILSVAHDEGGQLHGPDKRIYRHVKDRRGSYFKRDEFCKTLWGNLEHNQSRIDRAFDGAKPYLDEWLEQKKDSVTKKKNKTNAPENKAVYQEFEENIDEVVKILKDGISKIDKWIKNMPKTDSQFLAKRATDAVISILESFYPFYDAFLQMRPFLKVYIPALKGDVEEEYSNIKDKIEEIVHKCGQHPLRSPSNPIIPYNEMCDLKHDMDKLIGELSFCRKIAKDETNRVRVQVNLKTDEAAALQWTSGQTNEETRQPPADAEAVLSGEGATGQPAEAKEQKRGSPATKKAKKKQKRAKTKATKKTAKREARSGQESNKHSPDFKWVSWYGREYVFNNNQATAVRLLWAAHEHPNKAGVREVDIGNAIDTNSGNYRLLQTFRQRQKVKRGMHPAWGEMIERVSTGVYRLKIPKQKKDKPS